MGEGDVLGHEAMGVVVEAGVDATGVSTGDRVVIPFQIACGHCWMCDAGLPTQCETTQVRDQGMGAALFGYTKLYGEVAGGQAQLLRVPQAQYGPIKVPAGPPDERFLFLSDVLPTAWQAVQYAAVPDGGTVAILGLGPIGAMANRICWHLGHRVIAVDLVTERLVRAREWGAETIDLNATDDVGETIRDLTNGRGADSVIDAVGMEAHGSAVAETAQRAVGALPKALSKPLMSMASIDRLAAFYASIDAVRRGGTISLSGVYGGMADPLPMLTMFDKQIQLRMGQANVKRWVDDLLPLVTGPEDPLGVEDFATHRMSLEKAPQAYQQFQEKQDGVIKVVFTP